jgi:hypothetical protein
MIPASYKGSDYSLIEPRRQVPAEVMAAFLGWYAAEGSSRSVANGKTLLRSVSISQTKIEGREKIESVLQRLPWTWHWTSRGAVLTSKQLYDYIQQHCPGLQNTRRVPQWIKDAGREVIAAFVDAAVSGDGWIQKGHRSYATISKSLADDMAELFIKLGGSPSVTEVKREGWSIGGRSGDATQLQYWVRENNGRRSASLDGADRTCMVRAMPYRGYVYCATVPNGTLIVRRRGKMLIAGNCVVYSRAAASATGLDRFEERHWRELERQLGIGPRPPPDGDQHTAAARDASEPGGVPVSGPRKTPRRLIRSRWLS